MTIQTLSDKALIKKLEEIRKEEKSATLELLLHLIELDRRKLYREYGHSSLFSYCTERLGYSEPSAARRIAAARAMSESSELIGMYERGEVTLGSLSVAASMLRKKENKEELIESIRGKSKREEVLQRV